MYNAFTEFDTKSLTNEQLYLLNENVTIAWEWMLENNDRKARHDLTTSAGRISHAFYENGTPHMRGEAIKLAALLTLLEDKIGEYSHYCEDGGWSLPWDWEIAPILLTHMYMVDDEPAYTEDEAAQYLAIKLDSELCKDKYDGEHAL